MNQQTRNSWNLVLLPFSWIYGAAVWIRNSLYDIGILPSTGFSIPMISVGNITVGGTGKTPHVEYLVELLKKEYRLATLSRGYLRKTRDFRIASPASGTREVGDEPCQIKRRFPDVTVAVDRKRVNGVRELMKLDPPLDLVILDDAFQHRSLKPGFSILLIDFNRPMVRDLLLPAGRLREPAVNRSRASMILVTKCPGDIKPIQMREYVNRLGLELGQHLFFTAMEYRGLIPVFGESGLQDPDHFRGRASGILVVSGVVNPASLREYASGISSHVKEIRFPDHHRYRKGDTEKMRAVLEEMGAPEQEILILTTEKDAVKLAELELSGFMKKAMYAVRIEVVVLNDDRVNFENQIKRYVTSNKRSNILHQGKD
jgi:tetraacyldisaccharide 4'-kinase